MFANYVILVRIALMLPVAVLSGCYVMQAAQGQLAILTQRTSLPQAIESPAIAQATRDRLKVLAAAREFASTTLHLPDNGSYKSYVELNRDYVVWNVFATPRYSVEPLNWCFPIAGCVVYRGYFKQASAERYARRVRRRGYDATVAGAAAYSTLGHFDDPILSSMLRWSDAQMIGTLFHELAHQVVYVPGDTTFNESFASVVEDEGMSRWLAVHPSPAMVQSLRWSRSRSREFTALLLSTRERLRMLYTSGLSVAELEHRKPLEFGRLKFEYQQLKATWNGYAGYDAWFDRALNNADLVPVATYDGCMPGLRKILTEAAGDLQRFYAAVARLAQQSQEARSAVCTVQD